MGDLATAAAKEVSDSVNAAQKAINSLSDGSHCKVSGQDLIRAAQSNLNNAKSNQSNKQKAYDKAASAMVDFGTINLDKMTPGKCGPFLDASAYKNAVSKRESAKKALATAKGQVAAAQNEVNDATKTASLMKKKCECRAHHTADKAYKEAKKADASNAKAWSKAKHMACVLDGVAPSKCRVPATPTVSRKRMSAGVSAASCNGVGNAYEGVAMKINGASNTFTYGSGYWTNSKHGDFGNGNIKTDLFTHPARSATITIGSSKFQIDLKGK